MDHALTCNNLKCRAVLAKEALVTTCSHIFCVECAKQLGLQTQDDRRPACPACNSQLNSGYDAVITNLNPAEDYKTSILSGLSPNVIMECAGRALSFWAYQTTQDIYYQQYLYKTMSDKYSTLSLRLEKTVNDANSEIDALQQKMTNLAADQDILRRKNDDLAQAYREKSRRLLQTQELYDRVKRKAEMGQIEQAASDAVDSSLPVVSQMNRAFGGIGNHGSSEGHTSTSYSQNHRNDVASINTNLPRFHANVSHEDGRWSGTGGSAQSDGPYNSIGGPRRQGFSSSSLLNRAASNHPRLSGTPTQAIGIPQHAAMLNAPSFANNRVGLAGVGLTSGLKVSQPTSTPGLDVSTRHG